jgi:hypothetical protein
VPGIDEQLVIIGPYFCANNDGSDFDGCSGKRCIYPGQYCATDKAGNEFCSVPCTSDSACGNPGGACCNATCQDGGLCCGLCGS